MIRDTGIAELYRPRPIAEYHEDMGPVLWWCWKPETDKMHGHWLGDPPYVGSPLDHGVPIDLQLDRIIRWGGAEAEQREHLVAQVFYVGGWPGYHTHFTEIPIPEAP
jgi:hypothetical protein